MTSLKHRNNNNMANCDNLHREFNENLQIPKKKKELIKISSDVLRARIRAYFKKEHPSYVPTFFKQGSSKTKNRIRTKDDTCDLDDGVYFKDNPENVTGTTLQGWVLGRSQRYNGCYSCP
jgi:alpha-galactosidase